MSTRGNPRGRGGRGGSTDAASNSSRGAGGRGQGRGEGRGGPPRGRGPSPGSGPGRGTSPPPPGFGTRGRGGRGRGDGDSTGGGSGRGFGGFRGRGDSGPLIYRENIPARLPPPLEAKGLQQLVNNFKNFGITSPQRPLRPGYGTVGTEIKLRTNFFAVKLPKKPIFSYVVEISPNTDINRLKTRIFQLLEKDPAIVQHIAYIAHDRSQRLVSAKKLPQPLNVAVPFYDEHQQGPGPNAKVYTLSIKLDREFDPSEITSYMEGQRNYRDYDPLPLISALNLVLQQHAGRMGVRSGNNRYFFPNSLQKHDLGPGLEAVQGFYSSVRPAFKQLLVNVNVCMTAFVKPGNLADKFLEFNRSSRGAMPTLPKGMVKSIRVRAIHLGYKKKLLAIGSTTARNTHFKCDKYGGMISVEQYFLKEYKRKLQYPSELPVVNVGTRDKPNWLPAELCEVEEGNVYQDKLNDKETANMIRYACNKPRVNAEAIVNRGFPSMGLKPPNQPISGFEITIDDEMLVIPGRELNHPNLSYREGRAKVQNGSWNILDVKFQQGATVTNGWWVLVVQDGLNLVKNPGDIQGLVKGFQQKMGQSGMRVPPGGPSLLPPAKLEQPSRDPDRKESLKIIKKLLTEELQKKKGVKPSFVLVLLERRDNYIYPGIKRIGDIEMGIHTVHMQLEKANIPQKQDQYFSNVALKVNTKLGGINHLLEPRAMAWLNKKSTMMVGIDVTHPGPGSREGTPSIAAVVASVDQNFVQFPASLRIQQVDRTKKAKEKLDELREMMVERLEVYKERNKGKLPDRIFVYRDGVSEGQFDMVVEEEWPQILEALKKFSNVDGRKEYRPKVSIFICGKRHHAKFWPENSQFADRNGNTRPGTVVDKGITGVFDFDFYLQAHAGIQGHVKATHYTVVYDENNLTADEVQQGTHDVSYLYARATKAVSLVPAAYYADLACERGRCYLNDFLLDDKSTTVGSSGGGKGKVDKDEEKKRVFEAARVHWGQGLHQDIGGTMFYI